VAGSIETLRFVLFGDDRASSAFNRFARNVDDTTKAVDKNNLSLGDSRLKLDLIAKKAEELGKLHPDVKVDIDDAAAKLKLAVLKQELRTVGSGPNVGGTGGLIGGVIGSAGSAGGTGASGLAGIASMGPLGAAGLAAVAVAAGVAALALAPVAAALIPVTIGFGTLAAFAGPEVVKVFKAMTAQGTALKTALKNLSPAERDLLQQLEPLRDQFGALRKAVQPEIMKAFGEVIKIVKDLMPAIGPLVKAAAGAFADFLGKIANWLKSPSGQSFINWLKTVGPQDIKNFGRVLWDVAHGVGDALHWIYSTGSWIDRFLTKWHDDWVLVKDTAELQFDQIKVTALRLVFNILDAFSHIPFIGHQFALARDAIGVELNRITDDTRRAINEIQAAWDHLHGRKVSIEFTTAFVASHGVPVAPGGAKGMFISRGRAGVDDQLIRVQRGELVVPTSLVRSGAVDHLRGQIPGFAAGGLVGDFTDVFDPRIRVEIQRIRAGVNAAENAAGAYVQAHPFKYWKFAPPGSGTSGALGGDPAVNMALAKSIFPWPASQWPAFVNLEMSEAGFNRFALNPTSGAYGIPQALPPTKMPFAAQAAGGSHAGPQLGWMYGYIGQRYGNPVNAWAWHLAHNWYDQGGWLPPGVSLAYNGTGAPERVGGPGGIVITGPVNIYGVQDPAGMVRALQQYAERNGPIKLRVRS